MTVRMLLVITIGLFVFTTAYSLGEQESERLRFVVSGEPDTLDPQETTGTLTFQITRSLYDTLLEPDTSGELLPALATKWQFSPDKLNIDFTLRDDVYFHHGKKFTADDVVMTFNRILEQKEASPHALDFGYIKAVEAIGAQQLRVELTEVYAPILTVFASGWAAILPSDLIEADHNFSADPIGTGPFVFKEWQSRQRISLDVNLNYYKKDTPLLSGLDFLFITDPVLQLQAIERGDVDGVDIVVNPELNLLKKNDDVLIQAEPTGLALVLAMNTEHDILRHQDVRTAISVVIEKDTVLEQAYGGGVPIETFMDSGNAFYPTSLGESTQLTKEQALTILAQYTDATPMRIIAPQNFDPHVRAAQLYHDMLSRAGLPVVIEFYEWSRWLDSVYRGKDFEFTVIGHTGKLDPDSRLSMFGTRNNYVQWGGGEIGTLLDAARVELDSVIRKVHYTEILKRMALEKPFVYIGTPTRHLALRKNVAKVLFQPQLETYDFRQAHKK